MKTPEIWVPVTEYTHGIEAAKLRSDWTAAERR
jgi:hypothetical protein